MRGFLFFFISLFCFKIVNAQEQSFRITQHTVFAELGGAGLRYSVNYDLRLNLFEDISFSFRAGIAPFFGDRSPYRFYPIGLNILYGDKNIVAKIGIQFTGGLVGYSNRSKVTGQSLGKLDWRGQSFLLPLAGLRYQRKEGGVFVECTVLILLNDNTGFLENLPKYYDDSDFRIWPGLSVGYTFHCKEKIVKNN